MGVLSGDPCWTPQHQKVHGEMGKENPCLTAEGDVVLDRLIFCVVCIALIVFPGLAWWGVNQLKGWRIDDGPE